MQIFEAPGGCKVSVSLAIKSWLVQMLNVYSLKVLVCNKVGREECFCSEIPQYYVSKTLLFGFWTG